MNKLTVLAAGLVAAGSLALSGCGGDKAQQASPGMPPDVQAEFNRRMGGQAGTTAPQPAGGSPGAPTMPR